jgi:hypothetical protein
MRAHNGTVRLVQIRHRRVDSVRALIFGAITLTMIAGAPVIVLVGEPLRRSYLRRLSRPPLRSGSPGVLSRVGLAPAVFANPVLIALTAPSRWAIDQVGSLRSGNSGGRGSGRRGGQSGGNWPPAGVHEPRRPRPSAPAGAIALAEPKQQPPAIPILKALPPALSNPARRAGLLLRHVAGAIRWPIRRPHLGR